jgi:hypothetical protein
LSSLLEVFQQDVEGIRLFSKVLDDTARAANDLSWFGFLVEFAETNPFTKLLGIWHLDQVDVVLSAESFNKSNTLLLVLVQV